MMNFEEINMKNSEWFFALENEETILEFNSNCGVNCELVKISLEKDPIPIVFV